jgi:thiosulfate/3-mercaptopyruvate sulfurtransferase
MSAGYANGDVLVSTDWVFDNLASGKTRVAEVDYDPVSNYNLGHVPGAILFDWRRDFNEPVSRDVVGKEGFERLLAKAGVSDDMTLVLYGDFNNWFAAFAFWVCDYYGFKGVRLMNGGRKKWLEEDRRISKEVPAYAEVPFKAGGPDESLRTYIPNVLKAINAPGMAMVDVRGPKEFSGEVLAPPEYPTEHAQRGGHIPGAVNVPWSQTVRDDGTFKPAEELRALYSSKGVTPDKEVITYCRIGERSSHTWFVLKYLLGYPKVRNYDGSWAEWGNVIKNPIER